MANYKAETETRPPWPVTWQMQYKKELVGLEIVLGFAMQNHLGC